MGFVSLKMSSVFKHYQTALLGLIEIDKRLR